MGLIGVLSLDLAAELKNACDKSHLFASAPQLQQIVDLTAAANMELTAANL